MQMTNRVIYNSDTSTFSTLGTHLEIPFQHGINIPELSLIAILISNRAVAVAVIGDSAVVNVAIVDLPKQRSC